MFGDSAAPTHRRSRSTPRSASVLIRNRVVGLLALAALAFISCILCTSDESNPSRRRLRKEFEVGAFVQEKGGDQRVGVIETSGKSMGADPTWYLIDTDTGEKIKKPLVLITNVSSNSLKRWGGHKELFDKIQSLRLQLAREMNAETRSFTFTYPRLVLKHETTFNSNSSSSELRLWVECIKEKCGGIPQALLYHPDRNTIWYGAYHPTTKLEKAYFAITHRFTGSFKECNASDGPTMPSDTQMTQWEELKGHSNEEVVLMIRNQIAPKGAPPGCDWKYDWGHYLTLPQIECSRQ